MKTSIDIENRLHNGKEKLCYIPKINDIPIMDNGYILVESINNDGIKSDNLEMAKFFLDAKVSEINKFIEKNFKFINIVI